MNNARVLIASAIRHKLDNLQNWQLGDKMRKLNFEICAFKGFLVKGGWVGGGGETCAKLILTSGFPVGASRY